MNVFRHRATLFASVATAAGLVLAGVTAGRVENRQPATAAEPTPNCPRPATDGPCTNHEIMGNTYADNNRNGAYDPGSGDWRIGGLEIRLTDASTGALIATALTDANGYYGFRNLPVEITYLVAVAAPPDHVPTTPTQVEAEPQEFSTYWCCFARVDFGFVVGQGKGKATPAPWPTPLPPKPPSGLTPLPPPCCEAPPARQVHLPILNYVGGDNTCASIVEAQNIGAWPSKALLVVWGEAGACPPQCAGPLKVECSGLLAPGSSWNFVGSQLPSRAKGGMVFSAPAIEVPVPPAAGGDIFADLLCQALYHETIGDCDAYRRFKLAFNQGGLWQAAGYSFDFSAYRGASMAIEVVRKCPGDANPLAFVTSAYSGLSDEMLGAYDPVYGGYTFFAPLIYAGQGGFGTWLYVQNGGIECSSVELWFQGQDDCLRPRICDVLTLAPGETAQFDVAGCLPSGWSGGAWVRSSQPLLVAVDVRGHDLLMTYHGQPGELKYSYDGAPAFTVGSQVLFGPLIYSEYQGWDSLVQVQNLSRIGSAKVKVYFLDRSGNIVTTLSDWLCAGGTQSFYLPVIAALPGNWVGSVRVESQDWFVPGQPEVPGPNVAGVVQLIKYADVARSRPLEAMAYDLFPEGRAFAWQTGEGWGGLHSGVGRIGIPSFMKDQSGFGLVSEIAVANLVPKPGFTDFVIYVYDQNGLVNSMCQKLGQQQVVYMDVGGDMALIPAGFKGSAVISAVFWEHDVFDDAGGFVRNLVGLAAVKVERSGARLGVDAPGDESAGSEGFPILGPFRFGGPPVTCPGVPAGLPLAAPVVRDRD